MAKLLRLHVKNSRRKKYHQAGMDFSRIHASGTSHILSKGQQYTASSGLKRVVFTDIWSFKGGTKYLDATCLLYEGKTLKHTVDYSSVEAEDGGVVHSGDVMTAQGGTHTIRINLESLPSSITTCMFVISAFADATLADIVTPSVSFRDEDADEDADPLCVYNLDSHDKIAHLKSVIMCKLYRSSRTDGWHIMAIGDSHRGSASDYGPIYKAVKKFI
jgi:stress response protein SCP2